jgi:hypothetical protein
LSNDLNHIFLKKGSATSCPPTAVIILIAGIFLLYANAFLSGNIPKNLPSASCGLSFHILNGISYIGVSNVSGNLPNHNEYINGFIVDHICLGLFTISFCHQISSLK